MAFQIKKRDSYRWAVEHVLEQRADGKDEKMVFDAEFKALPSTRVAELVTMSRLVSEKTSDKDFLDEVLVGWHGLDDGRETPPAPFPYSVANRDLLLDLYPGLAAALAKSWATSVLGGAAVRKN